jgi:hypothetical protein
MKILNTWNPEVFLDNHTSDGADYQYVMTLIETQKDKQNPILAELHFKNVVARIIQTHEAKRL